MKNKKTFSLLAIPVMLFFTSPLSAQDAPTARGAAPSKGWYFGIEGGVPLGISTFSSFGHDKPHIGWTGGLYGGYQFSPLLSAELSVKYGQTTLSARNCCIDHGYWLGMDGVKYNASVLDMDCWNYRDLQSKVNIGQYGARLNINLLGLFSSTKYSRWSIALSTHIYAVSTKSCIQTISDKTERMKATNKWHLGYGSDLQIAYHLTRHLQLGVYSGITILTGSKMDAMPEYLHKNNLVWESGLRLGFTFGKNKKKAVKEEPVPTIVVCPEETEAPTIAEPQEEPAAPTTAEKKAVTFPDIYFAFNKKNFSSSEEPKLQEILTTLKENPNMEVIIKGWCDSLGSDEVNLRYAQARALAVKAWLIDHGISADRIKTFAMGSDFDEEDAAKARRASTEEQKN